MSVTYSGIIRYCPSTPPPYNDDRPVLEKQGDMTVYSLEDELQTYERFRCIVCGLVILILGIEEV